jgi:hypothetical protein
MNSPHCDEKLSLLPLDIPLLAGSAALNPSSGLITKTHNDRRQESRHGYVGVFNDKLVARLMIMTRTNLMIIRDKSIYDEKKCSA